MSTTVGRVRRTIAPRTRLRQAREAVDRLRDRPQGLRARLRAVEDEVQENRQLNRRIAELTDVVTELLLPIAQRDETRARTLLEEYRKDLV
ncbi:DUF6752 domain-containing protein [Nocardioides alcanivorans]|uniref:DUF6752 domain-containing protein n=1 Tax=Nocardioides alcanivorans TaxID=2897352 RepID=UPI001F233709|nr:DUF6752 domain-containing protein [Nocardioides alcanivorans]